MDHNTIQRLVARYNAQLTTAEEEKQIEQLLEEGHLSLEDLHDLHAIGERLDQMVVPEPSQLLDDKFYTMLKDEKQAAKNTVSWKNLFTVSWPEWTTRLAFASVTLVLGLTAGYFLRPSSTPPPAQDIATLSDQVKDLKEMVMLSLLEKESASERLKAVSLTEDMDKASQKVTQALIETLNNDSNVNVRLASLEALTPYIGDSHVREALVRSISKQESPLVQLAMAELMGALHVKSSVSELEKILQSERTPKDVKKKIEQTIQVLI